MIYHILHLTIILSIELNVTIIYRYALITGANKGIGFEICRKLASQGMVVILAARDERRGIEARERLKEFDNVVLHQLDVADPASVAAVFKFIKSKFGRLDILVPTTVQSI